MVAPYGLEFNNSNLDLIKEHQYFAWVARKYCEQDPTIKQIIPYCVIQKDDLFFVYQRNTASSGESRLDGLYSLGIGGHIDIEDSYGLIDFSDVISNAMKREYYEEFDLDESSTFSSKFLMHILEEPKPFTRGVLVDVSQVHLGLCYLFTVPNDVEVSLGSEVSKAAGWYSLDYLIENKHKFESWSQTVIDTLAQGGSGA